MATPRWYARSGKGYLPTRSASSPRIRSKAMSALHIAFSSTVIVGLHSLVLTERTIDDDERVFDLQMDGLPRGEIRLLRYYQPGVAVGAEQAVVWGGNDLYLASLSAPGLSHYEQDDTLLAAYPLGNLWCLVREI